MFWILVRYLNLFRLNWDRSSINHPYFMLNSTQFQLIDVHSCAPKRLMQFNCLTTCENSLKVYLLIQYCHISIYIHKETVNQTYAYKISSQEFLRTVYVLYKKYTFSVVTLLHKHLILYQHFVEVFILALLILLLTDYKNKYVFI